ncbi:hypothetical protein HOE04_02080 [archaeon]|jgi:hypothetical protein|nr:hypothetical protein [archaeon]
MKKALKEMFLEGIFYFAIMALPIILIDLIIKSWGTEYRWLGDMSLFLISLLIISILLLITVRPIKVIRWNNRRRMK